MDTLSVHLSLGQRAAEREYLQAERLCAFYGFRVVSSDRDRVTASARTIWKNVT